MVSAKEKNEKINYLQAEKDFQGIFLKKKKKKKERKENAYLEVLYLWRQTSTSFSSNQMFYA